MSYGIADTVQNISLYGALLALEMLNQSFLARHDQH
jgi:hypothetical protein